MNHRVANGQLPRGFAAADIADREGEFGVAPTAFERAPGLAEHGLAARRQGAVRPERLVGFRHRRDPAAPGEPACPSVRRVLRARRLQVVHQGGDVRVGQRVAGDVEHRLREARAHESVAEVVHVGEWVDVSRVVRCAPRGAQFRERIGTERREREEAAGLQDARGLGEHRVDVLAPGQHQVAEDEVDAGVRQRESLGLGVQPFDARVRGQPARFGKHAGRRIERDDARTWPARSERHRAAPCPAAEVEHGFRGEVDPLESREHVIAQASREYGGGIVARARAIVVPADGTAIEQRSRCRAALRAAHARGMTSASAATKPSRSESRCAAESATRRREVPDGTVGGRIAAT